MRFCGDYFLGFYSFDKQNKISSFDFIFYMIILYRMDAISISIGL